MKPKVIAVGGKKVGKTTTTENLIAEFRGSGMKIWSKERLNLNEHLCEFTRALSAMFKSFPE